MDNIKVRLGKVLIAFSLVILFLGLSFAIDEKNNVLNSGGINSNNNGTVVGETTNTGSNTSTNNGNTGNNSTNTSSSSGGTTTSTPNVNVPNATNGNENNQNNVVDSGQNVIQKEELTLEQTNQVLRKKIEDTYGIGIKFAGETEGYTVGGLNTVSCYDHVLINNTLQTLNRDMSLYPTNFFREMKSAGLPLTIYLIQRYSTANVTGITEKMSRGVIISIALDYPFSDTFHHENYHYVEHVIYSKGGSYTNWNNYNPTGFKYGVYDSSYVFTENGFLEDSFFVNTYAQSYEYEDRASTFEFMMTSNKISPLNYGKNVWLKAKVICETIDYYFNTVSPNVTEYWERFIYS